MTPIEMRSHCSIMRQEPLIPREEQYLSIGQVVECLKKKSSKIVVIKAREVPFNKDWKTAFLITVFIAIFSAYTTFTGISYSYGYTDHSRDVTTRYYINKFEDKPFIDHRKDIFFPNSYAGGKAALPLLCLPMLVMVAWYVSRLFFKAEAAIKSKEGLLNRVLVHFSHSKRIAEPFPINQYSEIIPYLSKKCFRKMSFEQFCAVNEVNELKWELLTETQKLSIKKLNAILLTPKNDLKDVFTNPINQRLFKKNPYLLETLIKKISLKDDDLRLKDSIITALCLSLPRLSDHSDQELQLILKKINSDKMSLNEAYATLDRDFSIITHNGTLIIEGEEVPVDRDLLGNKSPFFKTLFSGSYKEGDQETIQLFNISHENFKKIRNFLENGVIDLERINCYELLDCSTYCNIPSLTNYIENHFCEHPDLWKSPEKLPRMLTQCQTSNLQFLKHQIDLHLAEESIFSAEVIELICEYNLPESLKKVIAKLKRGEMDLSWLWKLACVKNFRKLQLEITNFCFNPRYRHLVLEVWGVPPKAMRELKERV